MVRYARARRLKRSMFLIPGLPIAVMAFGVGLMTPVPYPIAYALIGGLSADSVVKHPEALQVFPEVKLIDFDTATQKALKFTHPDHIERVWDDGNTKPKSIKHEGCFILHSSGSGENGSKLSDSRIEHHSNFFGEMWTKWQVGQIGREASLGENLSCTLFFSPHGLPGFLYWFLLYPFHWLKFRGLLRKPVIQSK
jgi:hypothetical protein